MWTGLSNRFSMVTVGAESEYTPSGVRSKRKGQRTDHAERGERDLAPSTPNHGAELDTESDDAHDHEHRARSGQDHGPRDGLEEDRLHGERGRQQREPGEQDESRAEGAVHSQRRHAR